MSSTISVAPVRFGYPVVLDLHGVAVLVVGGGPVAARKIAGLVAAGAAVRVVAPEIDEQIERGPVAELRPGRIGELRPGRIVELRPGRIVELRRRPYQPDDLEGMRLVVTATGVTTVDAAVAVDARAMGIWVNAADQPADCDFILPAIARQGPVSVAVSTDGRSPALAARLRDRLASLLTPAVAALAETLAAERSAIKVAGGSTEGIDWSAPIDAALDDALDAALGTALDASLDTVLGDESTASE